MVKENTYKTYDDDNDALSKTFFEIKKIQRHAYKTFLFKCIEM